MDASAFNPSGKTYCLDLSTDSISVVRVPSDTDVNQYRIINTGTVTAFIVLDQTESEASADIVVPDVGRPSRAIPVTAGAIEIITGPDDAWVAGITDAGSTTLYVTPGRGI